MRRSGAGRSGNGTSVVIASLRDGAHCEGPAPAEVVQIEAEEVVEHLLPIVAPEHVNGPCPIRRTEATAPTATK